MFACMEQKLTPLQCDFSICVFCTVQSGATILLGSRSGRLYSHSLEGESGTLDKFFQVPRDVLSLCMLDADRVVCGQAFGHISVVELKSDEKVVLSYKVTEDDAVMVRGVQPDSTRKDRFVCACNSKLQVFEVTWKIQLLQTVDLGCRLLNLIEFKAGCFLVQTQTSKLFLAALKGNIQTIEACSPWSLKGAASRLLSKGILIVGSDTSLQLVRVSPPFAHILVKSHALCLLAVLNCRTIVYLEGTCIK